jgi:hypothetical protein
VRALRSCRAVKSIISQEESVSTEDEYDFDNAYAEYLNDTDDGLYEDDTDDEDEYYGMSM